MQPDLGFPIARRPCGSAAAVRVLLPPRPRPRPRIRLHLVVDPRVILGASTSPILRLLGKVPKQALICLLFRSFRRWLKPVDT